MSDEAADAIFRYLAMAGHIDLPDDLEQEAAADRERYGAAYLILADDGTAYYEPLKIVRFLCEVCGVPLRESRAAVIEDYQATKAGPSPGPKGTPEAQAKMLFEKLGNVFEVREYALLATQLLAGQDAMVRFWNDVADCVEVMRFTSQLEDSQNAKAPPDDFDLDDDLPF
jgi:hypothetical protein